MLGRRDLATRLTRLIQNQQAPFVISIDGSWGTGKTFLLQRWQTELEIQGFRAIYFNAWEDDFCDDPLLAILGQLSEHFKEGKLKELASKFLEIAGPLLKQNLISVLHKHTGITPELESKEQPQRNLLQEYLDQRATKDQLKQHLEKMSAAVLEETGHPLVFIIDELDRCRPTFAIELLERVKHIFDVPNLVFVFGINRSELCSALQSVYGEIDAAVYLRRFFDMEFTLPEIDSKVFCRNLMDRFDLAGYFSLLDDAGQTRIHSEDFRLLSDDLPSLWRHLGLSLRDMVYCVQVISLVGRSVTLKSHMCPNLLLILIPLKIKNFSLYRKFMRGECRASEVMNYIDTLVPTGDLDSIELTTLNIIEASLYQSETKPSRSNESPTAVDQLVLRLNGSDLTHPEFLSDRTQNSDCERIGELRDYCSPNLRFGFSGRLADYVGQLIDLNQTLVRR